MVEIIPNWHPLLVHFTVALLPIATLFFLLANVVKGKYATAWTQTAFWVLWTGVALSVLTVASGIGAFNSVNHDTPSHLAMIEHRNWALPTFLVYLLIGAWSLRIFRSGKTVSAGFLVVLVAAGLLLVSTAWHGGELVYRHGLGVMSLPKAEGDGHDHDHGDGHDHGSDKTTDMEDGQGSAHPSSADHHDNSDGHHDGEKAVHDNSDGHHDEPVAQPAQEADHHDAHPHQH